MKVIGIFQVANFSEFLFSNFFNWIYFFLIFQTEIFYNFPNWKVSELFELEHQQISRIFAIWKTKIWLKKFAILELFVQWMELEFHSLKSHIWNCSSSSQLGPTDRIGTYIDACSAASTILNCSPYLTVRFPLKLFFTP